MEDTVGDILGLEGRRHFKGTKDGFKKTKAYVQTVNGRVQLLGNLLICRIHHVGKLRLHET